MINFAPHLADRYQARTIASLETAIQGNLYIGENLLPLSVPSADHLFAPSKSNQVCLLDKILQA
jgi:hypothetical protein